MLWLLLPYMAGLLVPMEWLVEHPKLSSVAAVAVCLFAALAARRAGVVSKVVWASATLACAFVLAVLRIGPLLDTPERWATLPPREVTLEVEILRVFPASEKKPTLSAIAEIRMAPELVGDLVGSRVYLSPVVLRAGGLPLKSHRVRLTGVIEPVSLDPTSIGRSRPRAEVDSFREFLLSNAVFFRMSRCQAADVVREPQFWNRWSASLGARFERTLAAGLPGHNSAAGAYLAMFLGKKDAMSEEQRLDYLQTGAMHLFAISGLHIAAIAACMHGLLRLVKMPELLRALMGIVALVAFVEATGGTPSARRALVMVSLLWIGHSIRRPANPIASIATAAFAVLLVDPLALRSLSFQFSYSVVAMLLLYGAPLTNFWLARWKPWAHIPDNEWRWWHRAVFFGGRKLVILTCASWSAAIVSTPLTVAYFGIATPGAVLANLVLIPVSIYSITAGFASLLCGLCGATWLSVVFNNAGAMVLAGMNAFAHVAADWPGMYFEGRFSMPWIASALTGGLLAICVVGYGLRWSRFPASMLVPPLALAGALVFLVTPPQPAKESRIMKSAYELAMERLQRSAPDSNQPLTQEQKERLAEIHRIYQGRIAEREIFLNQRLAEVEGRGELEEAAKLRQQIASERARLEEERDDEKERVRRSGGQRA